jgi:serine/threonine protein kinase
MAQPRQWTGEPPPALRPMGELAVGERTRVDLCRILDGPQAGTLVSFKRLRAELMSNELARNAFRDEIWMVSALKHENVARVVCYGEDAEGPFLATEFVYGVSLLRLMRTVVLTGDGFGERFVVYVAARIAAALGAAHGLVSDTGEPLDLVHRDLTPANVLVGVKGEVKLTDFGLAKAKQRATQTIVGRRRTHHAYMAPEQSMALPVDGRADTFSLGVLMFELFANRHPWLAAAGGSESDGDIVGRMLSHEPASLAELCPRIDARLVALVERCIARDPTDRYATANALAQELDEWLLAHGYVDSSAAMGRIVRRHALKQLRQFDRLLAREDAAAEPAESAPSASWSQQAPSQGDGHIDEHGLSSEGTPSEPSEAERTSRRAEATRSDARATASFSDAPTANPVNEELVTTRLAVRPAIPHLARQNDALGQVVLPDPAAPPVPRDQRSGKGPDEDAEPPASSRSASHDPARLELRHSAEQIVAEAQRVAALAEHTSGLAKRAAELAQSEAAAARSAAHAASQCARAAVWAAQALAAYDAGDTEQSRQLVAHALAILEQGRPS